MYIVTRQNDYESLVIMSAHAEKRNAVRAAEALVSERMDAWDIDSSRQDVVLAGDVGPATRACIASWRIYDLCTVNVFEVIVT